MAEIEPTPALAIDLLAQDLLFREARTTSNFRDEPVSDEQMRLVYDLVKYGPTSANQQPLRAVLVRSTEARERLVKHMLDSNRDKTQKAPLSIILAADLQFHEHLPRLYPPIPQLREAFAEAADLRTASARLNAAIQIGYFIVGVRAAGLDAGPMGGFDAAALNAEFFPDGDHEALVVMNVGVADGAPKYPRNPRLDYDEAITTV